MNELQTIDPASSEEKIEIGDPCTENAEEGESLTEAGTVPPEVPQDRPAETVAVETDPEDPAISPHSDTDSDLDRNTDFAAPSFERLDELRSEIMHLREEIAAREAFRARLEREYGDFHDLYPDIAISSLSDAVWKNVQSGTPLAAAYALEERRQALINERAQACNTQNSARSSGSLRNAPNEHYSPEEVRLMSQAEIRRNMPQIMESMKKW